MIPKRLFFLFYYSFSPPLLVHLLFPKALMFLHDHPQNPTKSTRKSQRNPLPCIWDSICPWSETVAANSQYVSLSFTLNAPFFSELSLPQTKNQPRVPKNIRPKSLKATPSIPFLHSEHTPKINRPDRREKKNASNQIGMNSNPMKVKTSASKFQDLVQELTGRLKLRPSHSSFSLKQTQTQSFVASTVTKEPIPTKRFAGIWCEILQGSGVEREARDGRMWEAEMRERDERKKKKKMIKIMLKKYYLVWIGS